MLVIGFPIGLACFLYVKALWIIALYIVLRESRPKLWQVTKGRAKACICMITKGLAALG